MPVTPSGRDLFAEPHLRKTTLLVLLFAVLFSLAALVWQWSQWGEFERDDLGALARLMPVFWSPYLGLALLALWLDRQPLRAGFILAGSVLVTLWGVYWHLDILLLRPSVMSQILSPLLIPGNQWLGVIGIAVLAIAAGWLRRQSGPTSEEHDRVR